MSAILKNCALMVFLTAFVGTVRAAEEGSQPAEADKKAAPKGIEVTWEGRGEMRLARDAQGEAAVDVLLSGKVLVKGEEFLARAGRVTYCAAKNLLTLEAADGNQVELLSRLPGDGPRMQIRAERIVISIRENWLTVEGAGALHVPAEPELISD